MKTTTVTRLAHFPQSPRLLPSGWLRALGVYGYDAVEDIFVGSHGPRDDMHTASRARLDRLFRELDGDGVFRRPFDHGAGPEPAAGEWMAADPHRQWRAATIVILRRLLVTGPRSRPVPRIPIGGGALSGKDLSHIDRAAACAARRACIRVVGKCNNITKGSS